MISLAPEKTKCRCLRYRKPRNFSSDSPNHSHFSNQVATVIFPSCCQLPTWWRTLAFLGSPTCQKMLTVAALPVLVPVLSVICVCEMNSYLDFWHVDAASEFLPDCHPFPVAHWPEYNFQQLVDSFFEPFLPTLQSLTICSCPTLVLVKKTKTK